jgi:hypothetical protein
MDCIDYGTPRGFWVDYLEMEKKSLFAQKK